MEFLIYKVATGRIESVRECAGMDGAQIIENVYGADRAGLYAAIPHAGAYPVGKIVQKGALVADPSYVPPVVPVA